MWARRREPSHACGSGISKLQVCRPWCFCSGVSQLGVHIRNIGNLYPRVSFMCSKLELEHWENWKLAFLPEKPGIEKIGGGKHDKHATVNQVHFQKA